MSSGPASPSIPCENPADLTSDTTLEIVTKGGAFVPNCVVAKAGSTTITVANKDPETHNFSVISTEIDITIPSGHSRTQAGIGLTTGIYQFYCNLHPAMIGTLVVAP